MFNDVMKQQQKLANKVADERGKVLLKKVNEIIRIVQDDNLTVQESVQVVENVKLRINSALALVRTENIVA